MQSRFNQKFNAPSVTPAGDDEAVYLLETSLREVTAMLAIFKFRSRRLKEPDTTPSLEPKIKEHRQAVRQHCANYFKTPPMERGEVVLNKRTYELLATSRNLNTELKKATCACGTGAN